MAVETVFGSLWKHADERPGHLALITDERSITYRDLRTLVERAALALQARGLVPGQRVCIETNEAIDHLVSAVAVMLAGGVSVCLPNDSGSSYEAVVEDADPQFIIANGAPRFTPKVRTEILTLADLVAGVTDTIAVVPERSPEDVAMIYYTSGTSSGKRKGVIQSYRALDATARYISEVMKLTPEVIEYVASPMDNVFWFGRCRVLIRTGGTALLATGALNPLKILSALRRHRGNSLAGDTPIFTLLLHHMRAQLEKIGPQLRWAKMASQAMPLEDKLQLQRLLPNARIIMNYGLTEAMRCCLLPFDEHPDKLKSVGRPSPGISARIMVGERQMPPGEAGEIEVRGANMASGYLNQDELWRARLHDGWYRTADLGYIDADGFVYILGRNDDAINVGGRKVAPTEVEEPLRAMLPGQNLAAFALPDPQNILGDVVAVVFEGDWRGDLPWPEFRARLLQQLPASHVPSVGFLVDKMPLTGNGKIVRGDVIRLAKSGALATL